MRPRTGLLLALLFGGCSITFPAPDLATAPARRAKSATLATCPEEPPIHLMPAPMTNGGAYDIFRFRHCLRATGDRKNDCLSGELLLHPNGPPRRALVTLIPGMGEDLSTEGPAHAVAARGFDVVRFRSGINVLRLKALQSLTTLDESHVRQFSAQAREALHNRACDYVRVLRWLDAQRSYDEIGISGVSIGGMSALLVAANYERIRSVLVMLAGGNLADILLTSNEPRIVKARALIFDRFAGSRDELRRLMAEELASVDPLNAVPAGARHVKMLNNLTDAVVRFPYSRSLRNRLGKPEWELILFPPGHYGSAYTLVGPLFRFRLFGGVLPIVRLADLDALVQPAANAIIADHFALTLNGSSTAAECSSARIPPSFRNRPPAAHEPEVSAHQRR